LPLSLSIPLLREGITHVIQSSESEILKLDESCISNPKSEIADWTADPLAASPVQFEISDFGFEMQDSSNFKMSPVD
jgi:hypothetical protein